MTDKHEATADSPSNEGHVLRFIDGDIPIRYSKHDDWVFGGEELGRKPVTHNDLWEIQSAIISRNRDGCTGGVENKGEDA